MSPNSRLMLSFFSNLCFTASIPYLPNTKGALGSFFMRNERTWHALSLLWRFTTYERWQAQRIKYTLVPSREIHL